MIAILLLIIVAVLCVFLFVDIATDYYHEFSVLGGVSITICFLIGMVIFLCSVSYRPGIYTYKTLQFVEGPVLTSKRDTPVCIYKDAKDIRYEVPLEDIPITMYKDGAISKKPVVCKSATDKAFTLGFWLYPSIPLEDCYDFEMIGE